MYDPHTRESRGFGFVTMEVPEDADAAIAALAGTEFMGKNLTIEKARYLLSLTSLATAHCYCRPAVAAPVHRHREGITVRQNVTSTNGHTTRAHTTRATPETVAAAMAVATAVLIAAATVDATTIATAAGTNHEDGTYTEEIRMMFGEKENV